MGSAFWTVDREGLDMKLLFVFALPCCWSMQSSRILRSRRMTRMFLSRGLLPRSEALITKKRERSLTSCLPTLGSRTPGKGPTQASTLTDSTLTDSTLTDHLTTMERTLPTMARSTDHAST